MDTIQETISRGMVDTSPPSDFGGFSSDQEATNSLIEDGIEFADIESRETSRYLDEPGHSKEPAGAVEERVRMEEAPMLGGVGYTAPNQSEELSFLEKVKKNDYVQRLNELRAEKPLHFYGGIFVLAALVLRRGR